MPNPRGVSLEGTGKWGAHAQRGGETQFLRVCDRKGRPTGIWQTHLMDPYRYLDFRLYLKDLLRAEKERNKVFSFRYFSRVAGFSSPSYLKMVMDGQRNLSPSSIHQFAKAFKLGRRETAYFEALVLFNQAKTEKEKDLYFERLSALRPTANLRGLEKDQYEYYTQKHFVIIREMVALPHFSNDPEWIAQRLNPPIKAKEVEHALGVLIRLGLLKRDEHGKLAQCDASVTTPPEVVSIEVMQFHKAMINDAKEALFAVAPNKRDISALTVPIPLKSMPILKQKLQAFREELLAFINKGDQNFDEVYQFNIQLFPVTKTKD